MSTDSPTAVTAETVGMTGNPQEAADTTEGHDCRSGLVAGVAGGDEVGALGRDVVVLRRVAEVFGCRDDVLAVELGRLSGDPAVRAVGCVDRSTVRSTVGRWVREGMVRTWRAADGWRWVSPLGGWTGGLKVWRGSDALLGHVRTVHVARLWVEAVKPGALVLSERVLSDGVEGVQVPDLEVVLSDGVTVAVECELSLKKPQDLAAKVRRLEGTYPAVWWFTTRPVARALLGVGGGRSKLVGENSRVYGVPRLDQLPWPPGTYVDPPAALPERLL